MKISILRTALFCMVICASSMSYGQTNPIRPEGVTVESDFQLNPANGFASFFFKDKTDRFWVGYGGSAPSLSYLGFYNGLYSIKNNTWIEHSNSIFTGYIERGDSIIFSALNGLHYFRNEIFKKDTRITSISSLVIHKGKLIAGSIGGGLQVETTTGFESIVLQNQGISYDSIYSLFSVGEELWIGTSRGLIKLQGEVKSQSNDIFKVESVNLPTLENLIIRDVVKDKYGKVWFVSYTKTGGNNRAVYIYENEEVLTINERYAAECHTALRLPLSYVLKFYLNKKGNVMIQSSINIHEFTQNSINVYWLDFKKLGMGQTLPIHHSLYSDNKDVFYAIDRNLQSNKAELIKVDTKVYSIKNASYSPYFSYNVVNINDVVSNVGSNGLHMNSAFIYQIPGHEMPFKVNGLGCASPIFVGSLWIGGREVNSNQLHIAAETYRQIGFDFQSGPIEFANDSVKRSEYNKIWKVNKKSIDYFLEYRTDPNYVISKEILEWPGNLEGFPDKPMAPFVDVNSNGIYEPHLGDYPKIKGDQMFWWIFNDLLVHTETGGEALGVEVHGSCYAYFHNELPSSHPDAIVNRTLIFNYKVINYSDNDYKDFKLGIYNDYDLGNYSDDRLGCDTLNNASFVYNATNLDTNIYSNHGFGQNPPIFFCKFLNQKMTNHMTFNNNFSSTGIPRQSSHYFNIMNSFWKDSTKLTVGEYGYQGDVETNFLYPGAICGDTGWTEISGNIPAGDRRSIMSTGIDLFQKDSVFELEFAYIMLHDPDLDFLVEECDKPAQVLQKVQHWYDTDSFPSQSHTDLLFANNAEWHYDVSSGHPYLSLQHYIHIGDSTIEGKSVRIVEEELKNNNGDYSLSKLYFHEDEDTVYLYNFEKQKFLRFLVFNVSEGGVFELDIVEGFESFPDSVESYTVKVDKVETKFLNGIPCKLYTATPFVPGGGGGTQFYMDRIGWFSMFYPDIFIYPANRHGGIRCYNDNDIDTNFSNVACDFMYGASVPRVKTDFPLNIYPNPTSDMLNIDLGAEEVDFQIQVMSTDGRILHSASNQSQLDVSIYASGIYYLIVKTESQTQVRKWIKL